MIIRQVYQLRYNLSVLNRSNQNMTEPVKKSFPCPRCGEASFWTGNSSRPFCSERCKLIDLGAWANEDYRVATQDSPSQITSEHDQD